MKLANSLLIGLFALSGTAWSQTSPPDRTKFDLMPDPTIIQCLTDGSGTPAAHVEVKRGDLNDRLKIKIEHIKPGLQFDLFTVERSKFLSDGTPDPDFAKKFNKSFGLAWYQSDLDADNDSDGRARIQTILLDQIFGFDPDVKLPPTNTFHVGFWFNNPNDAADCGFDVTKPTPFNGEHKAGPLAMISLPDRDTNLGPLCVNPDTSHTPATCNP